MSDELILNVSFDNQTVTDATENWTLSGTPNVTYEQISGGSGYSLVTGKLGTPPTLVAADQEAIYNEYTIDFNLYIKPSYTDAGWFSFFNLNTGMNYSGDYRACVDNGLTIDLKIGSSSREVSIDAPTSRWIHITIISEYDSDTGAYTAYLYVDSVLRTYRQGARSNGSPFAIGKKLVLFNRGGSSLFLPNTPGLAIDGLTVIAGIHAPNQTPAISLPNLSRVFQNFCTWLGSQLSAVAKSGSYNDLSDKPTISTVNDGTLTIQKNGTNVATFTANQSTAATANITVPTAVSELTNDSGYLTSSSNLDASKLTSGTVDIERLPQGALERLVKVANEAARYALTTADVQLGDTVQQLDTGIMYVVTDTDHLDSAAGYTEYTAGTAASVPWSGVTGKPTFAAVATSGAYSDLTGTPTIPTVNNATLTIQQNGTTVDSFSANSSSDKTVNIQCVDLTNNQTVGGNKEFTGTTTAHDVIPSATDTYNFGSSSYQWNNAYIKSLTINGVACGDILTHNASEFVDVSTAQTIGGVKTFSSGGCTFFKQIKINHNLNYGKDNPPSQSAYHNLMFTDANGWWGSYIENVTDTNGNSTLAFYVRNTNEIHSRVYLKCDIDGSFSMYPLLNKGWDLGTSTNKWKSFNGINPGVLSLPGTFVNVDTTNWVLDGSNVNIFTPASDGWLGIQATDAVYDQMHYVFVGRNDDASYHSQNVLSPINALWSRSYHGCVFIPVIKDVRYDIRCICSSIIAKFYPCQGNV